jgi:hypothetical protein
VEGTEQSCDVPNWDMKDLQIVLTENLGDVHAVKVPLCLVGRARKVAARLQGPALELSRQVLQRNRNRMPRTRWVAATT